MRRYIAERLEHGHSIDEAIRQFGDPSLLAESYLVGHDCADGAALDVMRSQVKFQSFGSDASDPALRCRAERVFAAYKSCADAGEAAERRCLSRAQAAKRDGTAVLPDLGH